MPRKPVTADKNLHIRVTDSQLASWKDKAESEFLTLSDWIRQVLNREAAKKDENN